LIIWRKKNCLFCPELPSKSSGLAGRRFESKQAVALRASSVPRVPLVYMPSRFFQYHYMRFCITSLLREYAYIYTFGARNRGGKKIRRIRTHFWRYSLLIAQQRAGLVGLMQLGLFAPNAMMAQIFVWMSIGYLIRDANSWGIPKQKKKRKEKDNVNQTQRECSCSPISWSAQKRGIASRSHSSTERAIPPSSPALIDLLTLVSFNSSFPHPMSLPTFVWIRWNCLMRNSIRKGNECML
jgi:hypothetical protein